MKLLLIDNYDSFTYNIVALLHQLSVTTLDIYKNDQITVAEAAQYDKIIISPGPATPHESGNVLAIIDALAPTHPILGICLGHQALGVAFGATLKNLPQGSRRLPPHRDLLLQGGKTCGKGAMLREIIHSFAKLQKVNRYV